MSIVTKLETWLRGIVRDEVSKIDASLHTERVCLLGTIHSLGVKLQSFDEAFGKAVAQVAACSPPRQENAELREHIKALNGQFAELRSMIEQIHPAKLYTSSFSSEANSHTNGDGALPS